MPFFIQEEGCDLITYFQGDIFQSDAKVLVNPVNVMGVMGKGLALEFKKRYPDMFEEYAIMCKKGQFKIGDLWLYKESDKWILNFPTKQDWREKSTVEIVQAELQKFIETYEAEGIRSIAFPKLGSGLGGLDWEEQVRPLMEQYLHPLPIEISIYV